MQRMSRAQKFLLIYILLELQKPRVIKKITRNYGSGVGKHGNDMHTTSYTDSAGAVAAVEANPSLSLSGYLDLPEIVPPGNPAADILRLYVEDFKGFPFFSFRDVTGMVRKLVRDSVFVGKNVTGVAIPANRAVYAVGSVDGVPSLGKARSNALATMPAIGVTLEEIVDGAFGRVMQVGLVENVDTSTFVAGDVLYVSSTVAGILVATAPLYPNIRQEIGTILVSDATAGSVQVVARSMFNEGILDHGGMLGLADVADHAYAFLHDGTRAMTGTLDTDNNAIFLNTFCKLEMETNTIARLYRRDVASYCHLKINELYLNNLIARGATFTIEPLPDSNNAVANFDAYNFNGAWSSITCATLANRLTAGADVAQFKIQRAGDITMLADKEIAFTESTAVTIDGAGNAAVIGTNTVLTPNGGAIDDLDDITAGTEGQVIIIRGDGTFAITVKNGVGNIVCGADRVLDNISDTMMLMYDATNTSWVQLAYSDNA